LIISLENYLFSNKNNNTFFICGDINFGIFNTNDNSSKYSYVLADFKFDRAINESTRVQNFNKSYINYIYVNNVNKNNTCA